MSQQSNNPNPDADEEVNPPDTSAETPNTDTAGEKNPVPYTRFKQVNDELKTLRDKVTAQEKKEADAAKEHEANEAKQLVEQQKYKELADKLGAKVSELEPLTDEVTRYKEALTRLLEGERKGLPEHITTLLDKLDPVEQLAYIAANKEQLGKPTPPDINAGAGRRQPKKPTIDEIKKRKRQGGAYSL